MWKFYWAGLADRAERRVEGDETGGEGLQDAGLEGEEMEFALALNMNEPGRFELLDVVGKGGGGDGKGGPCLRTTERTFGRGDPLEEFEAARIGEGLENGRAAGAGKTHGLCDRFCRRR